MQNNNENSKGDPLGTLKNFRKSRTVPKKNRKGGRFARSLPWPVLALGVFSIVSKEWTDQREVCGLKKKKGHRYSRAFSSKGKRAD